jgi:hypothetical protein
VSVTRGQDQVILQQRKAVYEAAKAKHPERWSGDIRNWDRVESVSLNPSKSPLLADAGKQPQNAA